MDTIRHRLEHDLNTVLGRVRRLGGGVTVEDLPGPIGAPSRFADEVDEIHGIERLGRRVSGRESCSSGTASRNGAAQGGARARDRGPARWRKRT
jgi:hypothetical protein